MNKKKKSLSVSKLISSLKRYYPLVAISVILTIGSVVLQILAPNFLSDLTDEIAKGSSTASIDMSVIKKYAIILGCFYIITAIISFLSGFIMNIVTQKYAYNLRKEILEKINRMPLRYFDSHPYGNTLSIVTNDVDTISQSLQQALSMIISSTLTLIGALIAMFITNWIMALTVLITVPMMLLNITFITKMAIPQFKKRQHHTGIVNSIVNENYTGANIIKLFNAEEVKSLDFDRENENLHKAMIKAQIFGGLMQPIMTFISYLAYAAVCIVGGLLMAYDKGITYGTIAAFLVYVNLFQNPMSQIAQAMNQLQMASAASSRVFNILEETEEAKEDFERKLLVNDNEIKGAVSFKNVKFGYFEDKIIIPNFSCEVLPGQKVAIVGPTGAGKTTLVNLLMRFYEINSGDILIDGVSIKDMKKEELRDIFGMVLQDAWIFDGTIKENLVYSSKNVSNERIEEALKETSLSHYVSTLPNGVDTYIKGESSLSQGQRQLLTIARAYIKNSPLLILDEATSNVDTRTEIQIQEAMDKLTQGRTSFVIAHRLSTIKNADLILVLKDGNIVEQGNHEELLKLNGAYAQLYNSQFDEGEE